MIVRMKVEKTYDVIVVGAGPGGSTTAALTSRNGLKVLLIDKARFPRDKICGDAIGGRSVEVLKKLDLIEDVTRKGSLETWGVRFGGPGGESVEIPFGRNGEAQTPPGYLCPRLDFDDIVFRKAVSSGADVWEETTVEDLIWDGDAVTGVRAKRGVRHLEVRSPLVIGADGAYSIVVRQLGMTQLKERHYVAAVRAYYQGINGFGAGNQLELHMVEEALPGYFWIFPIPNGMANVGLGMLSAAIKKNNVQLRPLLERVVALPHFQDRFGTAQRIGSIRGWGLPLGSKPRKMAGNGWMLVGDAASLIDPFSGEGIGNAMTSGDVASTWAAKAHQTGQYDAAFLKGYEREVMRILRKDLRVSYAMQRTANACPWLAKFVVQKAARSEAITEAIADMVIYQHKRKKLFSPFFYLRLLTA